jgi:hypothetical protein
MSLTAYRSNRVFAKTPEPVGRVRRGSRSRIFVVQKHDASRLHYDFRLAVNGVKLRYRWPLSGAGTHDGVGNLLQVGCGQLEGRGIDPAVKLP